MEIKKANKEDLTDILKLQKVAFLQEAKLYNNFNIQPLSQTIEEIKTEFESKVFLKTEIDLKIVGYQII